MKNSLKKLLFVILTVFSVIFIGACGKSKIDKKEVIEKFIAASESMKSGDMIMNLKMTQNQNGKKNTMNMTSNVSLILEPLAMKMEMEVPAQNIKMNSFIKDNVMYIQNPADNQWYKQALSDEMSSQFKGYMNSDDTYNAMRDNLDKIAESLSNTIPKKAIFFTNDQNYFNFFKNKCEKKETKAVLSKNIKNEYWEIDFPTNIALAIDICKYLNVNKKVALEGMKSYHKDPGSLKVLTYLNKKNLKIFFVNTLAANDPDSTEIILDRVSTKNYWNNGRYLLVNNRADRLSRLEQFVTFTIKFENKFNKYFYNLLNRNTENTGILLKIVRNGNFFLKYT